MHHGMYFLCTLRLGVWPYLGKGVKKAMSKVDKRKKNRANYLLEGVEEGSRMRSKEGQCCGNVLQNSLLPEGDKWRSSRQ